MKTAPKIVFSLLIVLVFFAGLMLIRHKTEEPDALQLTIPLERISRKYAGVNGFTWKSGYDIRVEQGNVVVLVAINVVPAQGVSRVELARAKQVWQTGIERIWSKRFALHTPAGINYPVIIRVKFKGPLFHHDVIVRSGRGRTDELNWNILDGPQLVAHEFGHMLGLYDEYRGGALDPQRPVIDDKSIMSANPGPETAAMARHYQGFCRWFMEKNKMKNVTIIRQEVQS